MREKSNIIYEDDMCIAVWDLNPRANFHFLVIPKNRNGLTAISLATKDHEAMIGKLMVTAVKVAEQEGLNKKGYRLVVNEGGNGCQTVPHLHIHVLGGEQLGEEFGAPGKGNPSDASKA